MIKRRGKQKEKHKAHVKSSEFYEHYSLSYFKKHEERRNRLIINRDTPFYVDYSTYCKVIDMFNKKLRYEILYNSLDFNMPYKLGTLGIRKRKHEPYIGENGELVNKLPPDWKTTLDLWEKDPKAREQKKLIRHDNQHTKGFIAIWYYSRTRANYKWKSAYSFIPCRTAKLELSKILKDEDNEIDYYLM